MQLGVIVCHGASGCYLLEIVTLDVQVFLIAAEGRGVAVAVSGNILRTPHFAEPFVVLLIGQPLPYSFYLLEDIIAIKIPCNFIFLTHLGGIKSSSDK
jgi:hypothetical protein